MKNAFTTIFDRLPVTTTKSNRTFTKCYNQRTQTEVYYTVIRGDGDVFERHSGVATRQMIRHFGILEPSIIIFRKDIAITQAQHDFLNPLVGYFNYNRFLCPPQTRPRPRPHEEVSVPLSAAEPTLKKQKLYPVINAKERTKEDNECVICMVNQITDVIVPCGHLSFCHTCIESLKAKNIYKCPLCNEKIQKTVYCFMK
jgi:hypothetical protein